MAGGLAKELGTADRNLCWCALGAAASGLSEQIWPHLGQNGWGEVQNGWGEVQNAWGEVLFPCLALGVTFLCRTLSTGEVERGIRMLRKLQDITQDGGTRLGRRQNLEGVPTFHCREGGARHHER